MNATTPGALRPMLGVLATEIHLAIEMVQRYESIIEHSTVRNKKNLKELQNFDLAVQILGDVATTLKSFSYSIPEQIDLEAEIQLDEIKLERLRKRLSTSNDVEDLSNGDQTSNTIDMF